MLSRLAQSTQGTLISGALAGFAVTPSGFARAATSNEKPAASMHELRDHFAACFRPPDEAAGTRVTFYFSLNSRGQVVAAPRTTWFGFKGKEDEKLRRVAGFEADFARCLPLSMSAQLAASIPGKVYFLQNVIAGGGGGTQALLRPFGSHYGVGPGLELGRVPLLPQRRYAPVPRLAPIQPVRPIVRPYRPFIGPLPQLLERTRRFPAGRPIR